jgi:phage host-nuclease inhibitor protein Gam
LPPGGDGGSPFDQILNDSLRSGLQDIIERLDGELDHPDGWNDRTNDQWRVQTLGAADWAMRKVAKLDRESTAISDTAAEEIDTITKWRDAEFARIAPQREHWTWLLADFHEKQLAEDPKAKTIKLPHGALIARKQPDNIEIEDVKTAMAWCHACNDDYLRFPDPELNRSAIKAAVLKNGEIIPGVEVVVGEIKYSVAPS